MERFKSRWKKFLRNRWVRKYFKAMDLVVLAIAFFYFTCAPLVYAVEYYNGTWCLGIIITWPLAYLCGYRACEILDLI
jgi:hypothetical protein